jgi:hypothetical protein
MVKKVSDYKDELTKYEKTIIISFYALINKISVKDTIDIFDKNEKEIKAFKKEKKSKKVIVEQVAPVDLYMKTKDELMRYLRGETIVQDEEEETFLVIPELKKKSERLRRLRF